MVYVTLVKYRGSDYTIELKEDAKRYLSKLFSNTKINKPTIKKEVNILIKIGVLKKINDSQWPAPTSIIPYVNAW